MANSDYEVRGPGIIAPVATLVGGLGLGSQFMTLRDFTSVTSAGPAVGNGVMIEGEILRITSVDGALCGVARGCADTIPQVHGDSVPVWFFDDAVGTDNREYTASGTVGVKVLMKTSGSAMEVKNSPPNALTFRQRFARPYPPGQVRVNMEPFHLPQTLSELVPLLTLTWAHRDRVTQDDTLQGHEVGSIGPEAGTTYTVRVYGADGVMKRAVPGIVGTSFSYTMAQAVTDFGRTPTTGDYFTLESVRDGFTSWQTYTVLFNVEPPPVQQGWGGAWGRSWGKV